MADAALTGLLHVISPATLPWLVMAVVLMTIIAIIPGLGGNFALVIMLPLIFVLPPEVALTMLVAAIAIDGTGNSVTSIFFGIPGSPSGIAMTFDGYPMAQRGEGTRALAAATTSSAVGGVIGALCLVAVLPVMRPLVLALSSPEYFMLTLSAVSLLAITSQGSKLKGFVAGGLGFLLAFVGMEISTGTQRYTFGQLYLWDGLKLVPVMLGLFGLTEMVALLRRGGSIAKRTDGDGPTPDVPAVLPRGQVRQGMKDVVTHWPAALRGSAAGLIVGFAPGLGGTAAQFLGYSMAQKLSKHPEKFGTGIPEGVIAPDASTNSCDGTALVPTLAFGIPGGSTMALLLAALLSLGLHPGPELLVERLDIVWLMIWTLVVANIMGAALAMAAARPVSRVTMVRGSVMAPIIMVLIFFASFATSSSLADVVTTLAFTIVGTLLHVSGYPRAPFVIAFVLGGLLERYYLLSMRLFGLDFLRRPVPIALMVIVVVLVVRAIVRRVRARRAPAPARDMSNV